MLRRTLALAVVVSALTAAPALALQWHSQMKYATQTASRSAGGCKVTTGGAPNSLYIDCPARKHAALTYTFATHSKVTGSVRLGVSSSGTATVKQAASIGKSSITVTVTVTGDGWAEIDAVSVGYYA